MVRLSLLGLVSTPKDSDCYLTQHGRLGMNQVPVQEGGFARRAEVLCFLSPRAGPEKPMFHAHLSVVRWIRNRRSTCTTKITYLGSVSMTTFPKKLAKVVRSNVKLRLNARECPLFGALQYRVTRDVAVGYLPGLSRQLSDKTDAPRQFPIFERARIDAPGTCNRHRIFFVRNGVA